MCPSNGSLKEFGCLNEILFVANILIADATKIKDKLGWTPQYDLETIVESAWNWHKKIYQD